MYKNITFISFIIYFRYKKPRNYQRKTNRGQIYSNEELNQAVNYVKNTEISLVKAAQQFQIPRNTIHRHVERKVKAYGCIKIFSPQQESVLKD